MMVVEGQASNYASDHHHAGATTTCYHAMLIVWLSMNRSLLYDKHNARTYHWRIQFSCPRQQPTCFAAFPSISVAKYFDSTIPTAIFMSLNISVHIGLDFLLACLTNCCRLLASLERQIVMNLLWLESAITVATMAAWVIREHKMFISLLQLHSRLSYYSVLDCMIMRLRIYLACTFCPMRPWS
jgi:hypothetical protein